MLTAQERSLIKGALRRVFARSDLRRQAIAKSVLPKHVDASRPRVKTWCYCPECKQPTPKSYKEVDHLKPVIGIKETLEGLSWDLIISRIWCDASNLKAICKVCHKVKTLAENKARRAWKKKHGNSSKKV